MPENILGASRITGPDVTRSILLVGELNPYGNAIEYALYHEPANAAGHRLQSKILGIDARRWYLPMWRTNLCQSVWSGGGAIDRAGALLSTEVPWRTLVLLGEKVSKAFEFYTQRSVDQFGCYSYIAPPGSASGVTFSIVRLPHPSGRNARNWSGDSVQRARRIMASIVPEVPWGSL
jgi:hypothetical protein